MVRLKQNDFPGNFNFLGNRIFLQNATKADIKKKYTFTRFHTFNGNH